MVKRGDLLAHWRARGIDPGRCFYTGWPTGGAFEVDHLVPVARGGSNDLDNLVPCLPAVKAAKSGLMPEEFFALLDSGGYRWGIAV